MTDRRALHLAEVLEMALEPELQSATPYPESTQVHEQEAAIRSSMIRSGLALGTLATSAVLLWRLSRNRHTYQ
jgi:hypothetical protein